MTVPVRVGIDLVSVDDVQEAIQSHADRYLGRVYTQGELDDCRDAVGSAPDAERLAARFAAKEATLKVLRAMDTGIPWRAIEVRREPGGWVRIALTGTAAQVAADAGLSELAVSLSHNAGLATAVVVGVD